MEKWILSIITMVVAFLITLLFQKKKEKIFKDIEGYYNLHYLTKVLMSRMEGVYNGSKFWIRYQNASQYNPAQIILRIYSLFPFNMSIKKRSKYTIIDRSVKTGNKDFEKIKDV